MKINKKANVKKLINWIKSQEGDFMKNRRDLAKKCKVTDSHFKRYLNGHFPCEEVRKRIVKETGFSMEEIFTARK